MIRLFSVHPTIFHVGDHSLQIPTTGTDPSGVFLQSISVLRNTRGDLAVDPAGSLPDLVVDPGLLVHRASKPCARYPYQGPPALVVDDERSPGVAQAGVVLAGLVPGAEHLGVELRNAKVNGHHCQSLRLAICLMSFMLRAAGRDVSFEG